MVGALRLGWLLSAVLMASQARAGETDLALISVQAGHGVAPTLAQLLDEALLVTLRNHGAFSTVLGTSDVRSMLDLDQQKATMGCGEENCVADIGGALGVPYGSAATVGKLGDRYLITLKIIDIEAAMVVASAMIQGDDEGELVDNIEDLVAKTAKAFLVHRKTKQAGAKGPSQVEEKPAAANAPVAEKPQKAPAVAEASARSGGMVVGASLVGVGLAASGLGVVWMRKAQSDFDGTSAAGTVAADDLEGLNQAFAVGNGLLWGGVGITGIGVWRMLR